MIMKVMTGAVMRGEQVGCQVIKYSIKPRDQIKKKW